MENYSITLKERSGKLYAHYYEFGILKRKSLGLDASKPNIAYAQRQIIPNLQSELAKGKKLFSKTDFKYFTNLVLELQTRASTYKSYSLAVDKFFNYFGEKKPIESYTVLELDKYISDMNHLAPATVKLYIAPIHQAFKHAVRVGIISFNPMTFALKPKSVRYERNCYTATQVWQMINHDSDMRHFLFIAFFTGMRVGEILGLEWHHLDFYNSRIEVAQSRRGEFSVGTTKSGKARYIPMINVLRDSLLELEPKGRFVIGLAYSSIRLKMRLICEALGFKYDGIHITRHTFASLMLQAKENPLLVKEFLGHNNLTMINKVYAHYLQDMSDCTKFCTVMTQAV